MDKIILKLYFLFFFSLQKYKEVLGFGDKHSIEKIKTVICQNNILNANFYSDEIDTAGELNMKIKNVVPISAIVNIDQQCEFCKISKKISNKHCFLIIYFLMKSIIKF